MQVLYLYLSEILNSSNDFLSSFPSIFTLCNNYTSSGTFHDDRTSSNGTTGMYGEQNSSTSLTSDVMQTCSMHPDDKCAGPCDTRALGWLTNRQVTATYKRGQTVRIKYSRNNHPPGGFLRLSFVKPKDMMNHEVHRKNAFHHSCWGASIAVATEADIKEDEAGFSIM